MNDTETRGIGDNRPPPLIQPRLKRELVRGIVKRLVIALQPQEMRAARREQSAIHVVGMPKPGHGDKQEAGNSQKYADKNHLGIPPSQEANPGNRHYHPKPQQPIAPCQGKET